MKKYLILCIAFVIMMFTYANNVSAIGTGGQFRDVTVGEVDEIDINGEEQEAKAPDTGIFGLDADSASIVAFAFLAVPVTIIFVCLFGYFYNKHTKMARMKRL